MTLFTLAALFLSPAHAMDAAPTGPDPAPAASPAWPAMEKPHQTAGVRIELDHPAAAVWEVIAEDYGRIAESHPRIVRSDYRHGSLKGELGAERTCWFNTRGTQLLHEQIVGYDPETMTLHNRVIEAAGFPIDPENSLGTYRVVPLGPERSALEIEFDFRARPAMMTGLMKGAFARLLADWTVAIDHHLTTGDAVTRDNFREIARLYR